MKFRILTLFAVLTVVAIGGKVFLVLDALKQEAARYTELKDPDPNVAIGFARRIRDDRDVNAIPYLIAALNDNRHATEGSFSIYGSPTVASSCWQALHEIGEPAARTVGPMLDRLGSDSEGFEMAIWVLSNCGDAARPYVSKIAILTHHEDAQIRKNAAWFLVNLDSESELVISELGDLLRSEYVDVRILGCIGLSRHRGKAAPFVSQLVHQLSHSDGTLRGIAAYTLGRFGLDAIEALPPLRKLIDDNDSVFSGHLLEGKPQLTSVRTLAIEAIDAISDKR